jgi:hypothetical protein
MLKKKKLLPSKLSTHDFRGVDKITLEKHAYLEIVKTINEIIDYLQKQ